MTKTNFYNPLHHHPDSPNCFEYGHRCDAANARFAEVEGEVERIYKDALQKLIKSDPDHCLKDIKSEIDRALELIPDDVSNEAFFQLGHPDDVRDTELDDMCSAHLNDLVDVLMAAVASHLSSKRNDGHKYTIRTEKKEGQA